MIGPWERIQAQGFAFRQAAWGPARGIVLAGIWLIFGPAVIVLPIMWIEADLAEASGTTRAAVALMWLLDAALLFRVTWNYLRKKTAANPRPEAS